jgi:hypothetical protein
VSLPNYEVIMRLMIDGEVSRPFSAEIIVHGSQKEIVAHSTLQFALARS